MEVYYQAAHLVPVGLRLGPAGDSTLVLPALVLLVPLEGWVRLLETPLVAHLPAPPTPSGHLLGQLGQIPDWDQIWDQQIQASTNSPPLDWDLQT